MLIVQRRKILVEKKNLQRRKISKKNACFFTDKTFRFFLNDQTRTHHARVLARVGQAVGAGLQAAIQLA